MTRAEIDLTDEQAQQLREVAATSGRSVSELLQESVELYLSRSESDRERAKQRARDAVGKFNSGLGDLGSEHDRYLEEDFRD